MPHPLAQAMEETREGVGRQDKRRKQQQEREDLERNAFTSYTDPSRNIAVGDDSNELSKVLVVLLPAGQAAGLVGSGLRPWISWL